MLDEKRRHDKQTTAQYHFNAFKICAHTKKLCIYMTTYNKGMENTNRNKSIKNKRCMDQ
jgi:hypothetical protein